MAEESFPVVEQPMSAAQWESVTLGIGDGILDQGGAPYRLRNYSNVDNTVEMTVANGWGYSSAIVRGFYHKIDEPMTLSIPAVTATTVYSIALQYDPTRTQLPVKLDAFAGDLDTSGGKIYLVLYKLTREPNQLLTDAGYESIYPRVAPTGMVWAYRQLPDPESVLYGTIYFVHGDNDLVMSKNAENSSEGANRAWVSLLNPDWEHVNGYYVDAGHGSPRGIQRIGKTRELRGRLARSNGSNFQAGNSVGYQMAQLEPGDVPQYTRSFITTVSGMTNVGYARIEVSAGLDEVRAWVGQDTSWISLDGVRWDVP